MSKGWESYPISQTNSNDAAGGGCAGRKLARASKPPQEATSKGEAAKQGSRAASPPNTRKRNGTGLPWLLPYTTSGRFPPSSLPCCRGHLQLAALAAFSRAPGWAGRQHAAFFCWLCVCLLLGAGVRPGSQSSPRSEQKDEWLTRVDNAPAEQRLRGTICASATSTPWLLAVLLPYARTARASASSIGRLGRAHPVVRARAARQRAQPAA